MDSGDINEYDCEWLERIHFASEENVSSPEAMP